MNEVNLTHSDLEKYELHNATGIEQETTDPVAAVTWRNGVVVAVGEGGVRWPTRLTDSVKDGCRALLVIGRDHETIGKIDPWPEFAELKAAGKIQSENWPKQ